MKIIRQILIIAVGIAIGAGMYYLYQIQLGSVSFLILSIIFFILGFKLLGKEK